MRFRLAREYQIMLVIGVVLFAAVNLAFAYWSPIFLKFTPTNVARSINPCYRTIMHQAFQPEKSSASDTEIVLGDSYSEGAGDEFLVSARDYGIFNKLETVDRHFLIYGRGGYGNRGTVVEFERCSRLLNGATVFNLASLDAVSDVSFIFYEGNDLDDNIIEEMHQSDSFIYSLRFAFPFVEMFYLKLRSVLSSLNSGSQLKDSFSPDIQIAHPVTKRGIEFPIYPQGPATELSSEETIKALRILRKSIHQIKALLPNEVRYKFLYLPSVASSYEWSGSIPLQSYFGEPYKLVSSSLIKERSDHLRSAIKRLVEEAGWEFCDATDAIREVTSKSISVHGPRDWKHFNKVGYSVVASSYKQCFLR